jgi:hypothetical protein
MSSECYASGEPMGSTISDIRSLHPQSRIVSVVRHFSVQVEYESAEALW